MCWRCRSLLITLFLLPLMAWAQSDGGINWEDEITLLAEELESRHKNLYFRLDSLDFHRELSHISREARFSTPFSTSVRLQQAVARLGDAHTRVNYHFQIQPGAILPVECYWFSDGIFILKTREEHREILGKQISGINSYPVQQIIDSLSTLIVDDNQALIKAEIPRMITWTQLLDHFGFGDEDGVEIQLTDTSGTISSYAMTLPARESSAYSVRPDSVPLGWQKRKEFFSERYFPGDKLYYIQYNKCWSREVEEEHGSGASALFMPSFKEFEKEVFQVIRKEEVDKLVFDMRFNGGGNSLQGTRFIRKLCSTRMKGEGRIYVVVGRHTFSSAIINTVDFLKNSDAKIVGEETGGRPNHYGEVKRFVLPGSNLVVSYSTKYFTLLPGNDSSILPGLESPVSFSQFMQGRDPAIEAILTHAAE